MSAFNDLLDIDVLAMIFENIDNPKDWISTCLVCTKWASTAYLIRDKMATRFSKMDLKTTIYTIRNSNTPPFIREISTLYHYLPNKNQQLHGIYQKIDVKRKLMGCKCISQTVTVKRFKFGTLVDESIKQYEFEE